VHNKVLSIELLTLENTSKMESKESQTQVPQTKTKTKTKTASPAGGWRWQASALQKYCGSVEPFTVLAESRACTC
jgi:hypothetical protein